MGTTNLSEEYTLQGFIGHKTTQEFSYMNFSIIEPCESGEILFTIKNLVDDYLDELLDICETVTITNEERMYYSYRPWLLAYNIYGNSELYWLVMLLNDIPTPNEFENFTKLKLPKAEYLDDILSEIYESESEYISKNRKDVENIVG